MTVLSDEPPLTKDPAASALWARLYEIASGRPIFSDRDGVVKYEIGSEVRGDSWQGNWGESVARAYREWAYR